VDYNSKCQSQGTEEIKMKKIAFLQLNELNFDMISHYIATGVDLPILEQIYQSRCITVEEEVYENLEPWIQWYSIFTGTSFKQHKVFRLGDGHHRNDTNFLTDLVDSNIRVGAIAPMNISKNSADFSFFIPDPWSKQESVGSVFLQLISTAVSQGVNNNSGSGLSNKNKIRLLLGLSRYLSLKDFKELYAYYRKIQGKSYRKALFLDLVLTKLHQSCAMKFNTQFSTVFLNAGAHIQHHYFLNSTFVKNKDVRKNPEWYINPLEDPVLESLIFYERILDSYQSRGFSLMLATGLQQLPYSKSTFYYRLKNHNEFLSFFSIPFSKVIPRMTRDFEIEFASLEDKITSMGILSTFEINGKKVFGEITDSGAVDDKKIFCTLTYDDEIFPGSYLHHNGQELDLHDAVNFVAVKNGKHDKLGTFYSDLPISRKGKSEAIELSQMRGLIFETVRGISSKVGS
jgi:hypothetical protein